MSLSRTVASGVQVSGIISDIPTQSIRYQRQLPAGSSLEDYAHDAFDLSNNPRREEEWAEIAKHARSLSSGDVVIVGRRTFLCLPMGWKELGTGGKKLVARLEAAGTWSGREAITREFWPVATAKAV
jgi:hypothetical protein